MDRLELERYARDVQPELLQLIRDLCAIPAPSHHEELRAAFCKKWFSDNGFPDVWIDDALNVLAPVNVTADNRITVIMAHTDTVFPDTTPMPMVEENGIMACPGVTDDTANLAVLMVCARYYLAHQPDKRGILFVANSCEEGLGNLKGTRKIMETYGSRVDEFISLDGTSLAGLVTTAVGSHRYKVSVRTEGGHSFAAFGNRNAIHQLATIITSLYDVKVPHEGESRTTYNVGVISGGTSVNTIAQNAEMLYEYRSDSRACLAQMKSTFDGIINGYRSMGYDIDVELVGDRPCAGEIDAVRLNALQERVRASIRRVTGKPARDKSSSTDCNIPMAMGVPSVCFGVCNGTGAHTREEKLDVASLYDGCRLFLDFLLNP